LITAVVAAAAATVMAGCGSSSDSSGPSVSTGAAGVDQLRSIFDHAQSSQASVTETFSESGGPDPDSAQQTCKLQLRPSKAAECETPTQQGAFRTIATPDGLFISTPDVAATGGKPWRKVDLHGGDPLAQIGGMTQTNGGVFTPGAATVTGSASDTVDGTSCTRYDLNLDATKLFEGMLKQTDNEALKAAGAEMAKAGGTATGKVWIGKDNLPVQTVVNLTLKDQPTQTQTIKYSDWGKPVTVTAPSADQITSTN
jgi:hypothetical protein